MLSGVFITACTPKEARRIMEAWASMNQFPFSWRGTSRCGKSLEYGFLWFVCLTLALARLELDAYTKLSSNL